MQHTQFAVLVALAVVGMPERASAQGGGCPTQPSNAFEYVDFAGPWERHGMALEVGRLGCGALTWRTYRWCSPDRSEGCDRVQDGAIQFGGLAEFALRAPHGTAVPGTIVSTSDPTAFALDDFGLALGEDGTLIAAWDSEEHVFCRPWLHDPLRCGA